MPGYLLLREPLWLLALSLIPALGLRAFLGQRRRQRDWKALGLGGSAPSVVSLSWLAVLVCLSVALARPVWGWSWNPDDRAGLDVVLAIDTSRSMACEDALPDRLSAAKQSAESLVKALAQGRDDRVSVVGFAGRAVTRCPLTRNLGAVIDTLHRLQPGDVSPGGTNLGSALRESLRLLDDPASSNARVVVIFSDGEDHSGSWPSVVPDLEHARVSVHAVALGDADEGAIVPDAQGQALLWQGQPVRSKRQDAPLRGISGASGGLFFPAGRRAIDLTRLGQHRRRLETAASRHPRPQDQAEQFPLFLGLALALGTWASRFSWRRRRLVLLALLSTVPLGAVSVEARRLIEAGCQAHDRRDRQRALLAFEQAIALEPDDPLPRFDAGSELFAMGRYQQAARRFREAEERGNPLWKAKSAYARANAEVALGRFPEAITAYDASLRWSKGQPSLAWLRRDARINRSFALRYLPPPETPEPSSHGEQNTSPSENPNDDTGRNSEPGKPSAPSAGSKPQAPNNAREQAARSPQERLESAMDRIRESREERRVRDSQPADRTIGKNW